MITLLFILKGALIAAWFALAIETIKHCINLYKGYK